MNKYHLNIAINIKYESAATKANVDCKKILLKNGFIDLEMTFFKSAYLFPFNLAKLCYYLITYFFKIPKGSLIITQYPLLGINKYWRYYASLLKMKECKTGCIIHDLDSLRDKKGFDTKSEIEILSGYDVIVSHNPAMSLWLKQNGYTGKLVEIMLFDFLTDFNGDNKYINGRERNIIFAGSLWRCEFLKHVNQLDKLKLSLYGPGFSSEIIDPNITWVGSFPIEEIIYKIKGDFGLIWDGVSIDSCTGTLGDYLKYNSPHKLSLYLTAGIPVILPSTAALGSFVREKNIGITINSLRDLNAELGNLSNEQYDVMKRNATSIGASLKKGDFFKEALNTVEKVLKT